MLLGVNTAERMYSYLMHPLTEKTYRNWLVLVGHVSFLILLSYSLFYVRQRMLHFDTANYVFHVLLHNDFYTPHGREINVLTQVFPLIVYRSGGSFLAFLLSYSASFVLLGYLIFCLVVHGFRSVLGGIYLVLLLTLTVRYKFYAPVGEVYQSLAFVGLVAGWLLRPQERWPVPHLVNAGIAAILAIPLLFTHPMGFLSFGAFYLIWLVYSRRFRYWPYSLPFAGAGIYGAYRYLRDDSLTGYEVARLDAIYEARAFFTNLGDYYVWDRFLWYWNTHYHLIGGLFVVALILLIVRQKGITALLCFLAAATLAGIALLLHSYLDTPIYVMIDGYLTHMSVGMGLAILWAFTRGRTRMGLLVLVLVVGFSLERISGISGFFSRRERVLTQLATRYQEEGNSKLLTHMTDWKWERLWLPWAVGIETLMMTTLNDPDRPATLYFMRYGQDQSACLREPTCFLGLHPAPRRFSQEQLPLYFKALPQQPYRRTYVKDIY